MSGGTLETAIQREALQPCFELAIQAREEEEKLKMQKKPDDPDMGNSPSSKVSSFLASIVDTLLGWLGR